jgi:hypothetical protein
MSVLLGPVGQLAPKSFKRGLDQFFMGTPEKFEQRSRLGPEQQGMFRNLMGAAQGSGAGGAFGDAADYYRSLVSGADADVNAMAAPEMRRFQQEIVPGLASQFGGLGAGALNSSGFRNAMMQSGTDLAERIAAMRAGLRMQGAQGLQGIGQQSLGDYFQNMFRPRQAGFLEQLAPGIGSAIGGLATGGVAGGLTAMLPHLLKLFGNQGTNQSDYGVMV